MRELLKIEIEAICVVHIVAIILSIIFFMIFYMKAKRDYSLNAFLVIQISMIGWMVFKIFKTVSPTEISRWWFIVGYYFCACIFEVSFLEFTYSNYKGKPIKKKMRYILYLVALLQFSWIITNPYHYLFYSRYDFWGDSFGILFYVYTVIVYSFILVGFVYGCKAFNRRFKGKKWWYKLLIASTIILPLILNYLFITKILHRFVFSIGIPVIFDITPIVFLFSTMVFAYATFNHEFMNLSPIMKYEIVHKLDTPICVLDSSFEVIYTNERLEETFKEIPEDKLKNLLNKALKSTRILRTKNGEISIDDKIFVLSFQEVKLLNGTQYLVTLNNISDYKKIESKILLEQKELKKTNFELTYTIEKLKKTSKIGARNYVARELHDIIGHSLVVTIKLLEVARLYFDKDKKLTEEVLLDSVTAIETGIESMESITEKERDYTGNNLKKDLMKILDRLKTTDINTKLNFKGVYSSLEEKTYDMIRKICLELVTNSLKHSQASEIFMSVNVQNEEISILFMDNGIGCEDLVIGNGLSGIKKRLSLSSGKVEFITSLGEGFMSKISIIK